MAIESLNNHTVNPFEKKPIDVENSKKDVETTGTIAKADKAETAGTIAKADTKLFSAKSENETMGTIASLNIGSFGDTVSFSNSSSSSGSSSGRRSLAASRPKKSAWETCSRDTGT